jgi:NADPH-dependent 2,4-dienoyl-CoA reductase/sulfur reductase-like enzyme/nitrite reductase/ring-hydroxylating ferredoxin subunit
MGGQSEATGPDFGAGVALSDIPGEGTLAGRVGDEAVLVSRLGGELFAIGATCTHYGGPLAEGLAAGGTVRCPWHHACFDLRTGEAVKAPAFDPVPRWKIEVEKGRLFLRSRLDPAPPRTAPPPHPDSIVIVGGGAAGFAAAEMLRRLGYRGALTMLSEDENPPCDRPNLSKDYLAGAAPEEWVLLKDEGFYRERDIDLRLGTRVDSIDVEARRVVTADGAAFGFDALLLATGAEPVRLPLPGFDHANVHVLRSLGDSRAIIAAAKLAKKAVVIGASFIGLEAAAALRTRGLDVHVVAPDPIPMARVLGPEIGANVQRVHERKGVVFHLQRGARAYDGKNVILDNGEALEADLVVLGVGVKPRTALAAAAGIAVDDGVIVDEHLETGIPGIYAAGDIASYKRPGSNERLRVEHWVVAERQGQAAAANMLGMRRPFRDAPFFWSNHYDVSILYVGHATAPDEIRVEGSVAEGDAIVRFFESGKMRASAAIGRPLESLRHEVMLEKD